MIDLQAYVIDSKL